MKQLAPDREAEGFYGMKVPTMGGPYLVKLGRSRATHGRWYKTLDVYRLGPEGQQDLAYVIAPVFDGERMTSIELRPVGGFHGGFGGSSRQWPTRGSVQGLIADLRRRDMLAARAVSKGKSPQEAYGL